MLLRSFFVVFVLLLAACSKSPSLTEELSTRYLTYSDDFKKLRLMAKQDIGSAECLYVGLDGIQDYLFEKQVWTIKNEGEPIDEQEVFTSTGISKQRFRMYTYMLNTVGAASIMHCAEGNVSTTGAMLYRTIKEEAETVCSAFVTHFEGVDLPESPASVRPDGEDNYVRDYGNNWYFKYSCEPK